MIELIIGWVAIAFAILSFIIACIKGNKKQIESMQMNERYFIAYLLIAAICFHG